MIPLDWDPSSNVVLLVAAPTGGVLDYPALAQGDPGPASTFDTVVNFTALAYTDPTVDSASMTLLSPGYYQLNLALHTGGPGPTGTNIIHTAGDLVGTPVSGKIIIVNPTLDGFLYATPKVGDWFGPATIANTPSGNPGFTLCTVGLGPFDFDWRPQVSGYTIVTGTGPNVVTDLVARLNSASGNDVGRCPGMTSTERLILSAGPPTASADTWDRVLAGNAATIYLRAERQSGTDTFTTSATTTRFRVKANPVP
jgi:hypothetical protein